MLVMADDFGGITSITSAGEQVCLQHRFSFDFVQLEKLDMRRISNTRGATGWILGELAPSSPIITLFTAHEEFVHADSRDPMRAGGG